MPSGYLVGKKIDRSFIGEVGSPGAMPRQLREGLSAMDVWLNDIGSRAERRVTKDGLNAALSLKPRIEGPLNELGETPIKRR